MKKYIIVCMHCFIMCTLLSQIPHQNNSNIQTLLQKPESSENYIMSISWLDERNSEAITFVQYYDEFGYPNQLVVGGLNTKGLYLNYLSVNDGLGRVSKQWCPIAVNKNPEYIAQTDFENQSRLYYNSDFGYNSIFYDRLGRVTTEMDPGFEWQNRPQTTVFTKNLSNTVKKYKISSNTIELKGYYLEGNLKCIISVDENNDTLINYYDLKDRLILEQRGSQKALVETYYIYNNLGLLSFVLQPMYIIVPNF